MEREEAHLSDQSLLLAGDGELTPREAAQVEAHLAACWACRARKQEIEAAVGDFIRAYRHEFDGQIPEGRGPRALLQARMTALAEAPGRSWLNRMRGGGGPMRVSWAATAVAAVVTVGLGYGVLSRWTRPTVHAATITTPDRSLTPGAAVLISRDEVCRETNTKNKLVPAALEREVFREYGIRRAQPRAYEVDYLITPALGGADDIHNLWPESNAGAVWNAQVKDALEDRLRDMVCSGQLDLATAQRDIAGNWIEAYKKYFHTDQPIPGSSPER